eukprot:TRINITY_DN9818_c0_g1_i1.p1 TRINITY_DN9818_c0_g1~~TRINITY_DN9818_c0_g1_i1.p1  ORF type:complete len:660 (+),score=135.78 TRINITY_DN9818_c0_g1_i1:23-2002(+)
METKELGKQLIESLENMTQDLKANKSDVAAMDLYMVNTVRVLTISCVEFQELIDRYPDSPNENQCRLIVEKLQHAIVLFGGKPYPKPNLILRNLRRISISAKKLVTPSKRTMNRPRNTNRREVTPMEKKKSLHFAQLVIRKSLQDTDSADENTEDIDPLFNPVVYGNQQMFVVEDHTDSLPIAQLNIIDDVYNELFFFNSHINYLGFENDECKCIVSVLNNPDIACEEATFCMDLGTSYKTLICNKHGHNLTSINNIALSDIHQRTIGACFEEFFNRQATNDYTYYLVKHKLLPGDIRNIEKTHRQSIKKMKIAILYAKNGQTMQEIFENQPPQDSLYWKFLNELGEVIDLNGWSKYKGDFGEVDQQSYYTIWKGIEIMFHVGPMLTVEQHRRLLGNDIAFIIFNEEDTLCEFDPSPLDELGTVPQLFSIVQTYRKLYRVGFFNRSNIKPFGPPPPPSDYCFDIGNVKDFLLTKVHNGLMMARKCPPMNRLFTEPRAQCIKEIGEKYPQETLKQMHKREITEFKERKEQMEGMGVREELNMKIMEVSNLPSSNSAYVQVRLLDQKKKTSKSSTGKWKSKLVFDLLGTDKTQNELELTVYMYDRFGSDSSVGHCVIGLQDAIIISQENRGVWYDLFCIDSVQSVDAVRCKVMFEYGHFIE